jgi:hypothetical protein
MSSSTCTRAVPCALQSTRRHAPGRRSTRPSTRASNARDVLDHLLGGQMRAGVQVECSDGVDTVRAHADVVLPSWFPAVIPDWTFSITGSAVKEREP